MRHFRYRSRRLLGGRTSSSSSSEGSKAGKAVLWIVGIGLAVYLLTAGFAGKWVAENIVTPVVNLFGGGKQTSSPAPTGSVNPTQQAQASSVKLNIPGFTQYLIQLGAFSSMQNAETQAALARERGAAGYIFRDGGFYKVIAVGFANESDAKTVKDKLLSENNLESMVFKASASGMDFNITASAEQILAIEDAFSAYTKTIDRLEDISVKYDLGANAEETKNSLKEAASDLGASRKKLEQTGGGTNDITSDFLDLMEDIENEISDVAEFSQIKKTEFAATLKYLHIMSIDKYIKFEQSVTNA